MIDLSASYTHTVHIPEPTVETITPAVKRRTTRDGATLVTVSGLIPLFADRFNAIADEGERGHALTVFRSARIVISDAYDAGWDSDPQAREGGRLRTTYRGGAAGITVDEVLDLAARLRTQLSA
ncbi:hypothetical protein ACIHJG_37280 [Streptomyces sp. NPDC052415]|uniref:hypothetical protein n=1 Tax=Streptomyces sp. NPDC052415 TaxID=3365690 RepID=UPI0037D1FA94